MKIDFPLFEGIDVLNYIFKAEKFFCFYHISDPYRLEIASIHFDGPIVPWFQILQKVRTVNARPTLVQAL